jgi:V8-like Glu-specific endopeptidase
MNEPKVGEKAMRNSLIVILALGLLGWGAVEQATAQLLNDATHATAWQDGSVTVFTVPHTAAQVGAGIDFVHAQPMQPPSAPARSQAGAQEALIRAFMSQSGLGASGVAPGEPGNGKMNLIRLGVPKASAADADEVRPGEFGTSHHPFSTARADLIPVATNTSYPYRAAGKLFYNVGSSTFTCSASLIARGVVVTAAHCVAAFGQGQFYANWHFVPGYRNGDAPYGVWTVRAVHVLPAWLTGTDPCAVAGVTCQNDVAVLLLNASATGDYPGTATGWYGLGWDSFGFTANGLTQITQLGYPAGLDNAAYMERNDAFGYRSPSDSDNTIIGSLMTIGASGGPWLVNFGIRPVLTGTTAGANPTPNVVVGVASWLSRDDSRKEWGASPFLSSNIVPLVIEACTAVPAACS